MNPDDFWELSQGEINIKMVGYAEEREAQIARDWNLGQLLMIGYHEPKKYPKLSAMLPKRTKAKAKEETFDDRIREHAKKLGIKLPG
jgi:hypothetical protein